MSNLNVQLKNGNDNLFPNIIQTGTEYTDSECVTAFVQKMNEISSDLGMDNTNWINPSGLRANGSYSSSTVRDLARMGIEALSYNVLCNIWNKSSRSIRIKDSNNIAITTSVTSATLENYYPIIGGKTGGGDGYYTLVVVTKIGNDFVCGAIAEANSTDGRFQAMKELFDAAEDKLNGNNPAVNSVTSANCACAFRVPNVNTSTIKNKNVLECLYEQNADKSTPPMSTTKVMTVITALKYINNVHKQISIHNIDLENTSGTSGAIFQGGEILSFEDLLYACLLPSSNQAANAIARITGKYILNENNFCE